MTTSRRAPVVALLLAALVAACTPATSDGGEIVVAPDARVEEVLAARDALLAPVPTVTAQAERLAVALEELWVTTVDADRRVAVVDSLRTEPFDDAVAALAAVELEGEGPDVQAARAAVATMLDDAEAMAAAVAEELESLEALAAFDEELLALPARWDEPGQYSAQLQAFEDLAAEARLLAADAAERTVVPSCTEAWQRRTDAATTIADRTDELRVLIRDRRGQEFDELRDEYRQDPFGFGALLGDLDVAAAESCWSTASRVPSLLEAVLADRDDVAAALDPDDL